MEIKKIEKFERGRGYFYKTNLVKCVPLSEFGKIRYPNVCEMDVCFKNLVAELLSLKPRIVFLLGNKVSDFVLQKIESEKFRNEIGEKSFSQISGIEFKSIWHPSYVAVYKRKKEVKYIQEIENMISSVIKE